MLESYLRQLMADHRINDISELMETTGISRNSINKLYREVDMETLKLETLMKICDTFNIRLSDLIQYTPSEFVDHTDIRVEELKRQLSELIESSEWRGAPRSSGRKIVPKPEYLIERQQRDEAKSVAEESVKYNDDTKKDKESLTIMLGDGKMINDDFKIIFKPDKSTTE